MTIPIAIWGPLAILGATLLLNKGLTLFSREKRLSSTREDLLFWPDWLSSGGIAVIVIAVQIAGTPELTGSRILGVVLLLFSSFCAVALVSRWGYSEPLDPADPPILRKFSGIVVPNALALAAMTVAVVVGLDVTAAGVR